MENIGFEFNPYNPYFTIMIKVGKHQTVIFHADDVMPSHMKPKVDDKFSKWMNRNYGKHDKVKANRGKVNEYLVMTFNFTEKLKVKINMDDYVEWMINELPIELGKSDMALTPAGNNIFEKGNMKSLGKK